MLFSVWYIGISRYCPALIIKSKHSTMDNKATQVSLPGLKITTQFLMLPAAALFVFVYIPLMLYSDKTNTVNRLVALVTVVGLSYVIGAVFLSRFKSIIYSSEKIEFVPRYGNGKVIAISEVAQIGYYPWLRVYIKNNDAEIEEEVEHAKSGDFPNEKDDIKRNMQKVLLGVTYFVYPVVIKAKQGGNVLLMDEKTLKVLEEMCSAKKSGKIKSFTYNENWNWFIFAIAIFGIIYYAYYFLTHLNQ